MAVYNRRASLSVRGKTRGGLKATGQLEATSSSGPEANYAGRHQGCKVTNK